MILQRKTIRYYYWLTVEFIKKHLRIILLSFFISFIAIISIISFSPYIQTFLLQKKDVVGLVGEYDFNTLPEEVTKKISNGLLFINEKGDLSPALASSWESLDKGKEYRFHLRDGLIWSDGKKFSASDINFKFSDIQVEVVDDKTLYFKLKEALPIFPAYLNEPILKYPLQGVAGLYKVDQIKTKYGIITELTLSPNKKDLPVTIYKFYKNETDLVNAYKRGEINQMSTPKKTVADVFKDWRNSSIAKSVDYSKLMTLFFNNSNQFMKDKEVRDAFISAIDKRNFELFGEIALGPIPPTSWAYSTNIKPQLFDKVIAEKTLDSGEEASASAEIKLYTYYDYLNIAEQISKDLKDVGLKVTINLISLNQPENFDLLLAFWNIPEDPDQYFYWHSTQKRGNLSNYMNVKIDKLLEDGRNTSNINERKRYYLEFQKVLEDDPPADFLFFPYIYTIKRK